MKPEQRSGLTDGRGEADTPADLLGLIGSIPEALFRASADGRTVFVSAAIESLLGHKPADLIGKEAETLYVNPEDRIAFVEAVTASTGTFADYQTKAWHKDGSIVDVAMSARALYDGKGTFLGIEGSIRNITHDLKARESIERAERRYRELVEGLRDGVLIVRDGTIRYGNPAAQAILGLSAPLDGNQGGDTPDFGEQSFLDSFPTERQAFMRAWLNQVQNTRKRGQRTFVLRDEPLLRPGGTVSVDISAHPMNDPEGNGSVQLIIHDLSEQKHEEAMLRLSERVFQSTPDMVAIVDSDFRYRLANQSFCTFNGVSINRVTGMAVGDFISTKTFTDIVRPRMQLCLGGQILSFETWFESRSQGRRYMEVTYTPMESHRGSIDSLIVIARDMTDRKLAEESLQESEKRVRLLNRDLEDRVERKTRDLVAAQEGLVESEAKFRAIAETSPTAIMLSEPEGGRILFANPAACDMLGYDTDEIFNVSAHDLYADPTDRSVMISEIRRTGATYSASEQYRRGDGATFWGVKSAQIVVMGGREVIVSVISDISVLKDTEDALRKSEARFRDIVETASDWFWETGPDLRFTVVPHGFQEITGVPRENLLGKTRMEAAGIDFDSLVGAERDKWERHMADMENRRTFRDFEYRLKTPERGTRILRVSGQPYFNADGMFLGYRGSSRDITDIYKNRENLRKRTRALEQSPLMVFITDREGVIEYVNPAFTDISGYSADEAVGRTPKILKSPYTPREVHAALWNTIAAGKNWSGELQDMRKDGTFFWAYVMITPVRDDEGVITHYVAMHEDISERKDTEMKVRKARDEAEIATRAKSEFLSAMSHELRTPLNAIIGFSELMKAETLGPMSNEQYLQYSADIHESGSHLLEIINDILDISAIENGKLALHDDTLDLSRIFASVRKMVLPRASEKSLQVELSNLEHMPRLYADERRVKQLLLNLASNAVKFTPGGGRVWLEGGLDDEGRLCLRVRDTGIGMSEEGIKKALSRFGQVDSSLARRYEGAGLGLPLAKELAELHDGTLSIESTPGVGTTVTVVFPAERTVLA